MSVMKTIYHVGLVTCIAVLGCLQMLDMNRFNDEQSKERVYNNVPDMVQSVSGQLNGEDGGTTSGTVFNRMVDGVETSFILTCAHGTVDFDIEKRFTYTYYLCGSQVQTQHFKVKQIYYSPPHSQKGVDLAIYQILDTVIQSDVEFFTGTPHIGDRLIHSGTFIQKRNHEIVVQGIVSYINQYYNTKDPSYGVLNIADMYVTPGCSGGGIFDRCSGQYRGMTLIKGPTFGHHNHLIPGFRDMSGDLCMYTTAATIQQHLLDNGFGWFAYPDEYEITAEELNGIVLDNSIIPYHKDYGKKEKTD